MNAIEDAAGAAEETKSKGFRGRKIYSKTDRMANKIKSGTLNENFVKIDIKKKTFVKGKKFMTGSKYRRLEWKRKQGLKGKGGGGGDFHHHHRVIVMPQPYPVQVPVKVPVIKTIEIPKPFPVEKTVEVTKHVGCGYGHSSGYHR